MAFCLYVCLFKKKSFKDVKIRLFVCFKCLQEIQTSEKVGKLIRSIHTQRLGGLSMAWAQGRDCPLQHLCKWWCLGKGHSLWQPSPWVCFPPQSVNVVVLPSPGEDVPSCSESQPVLRASHPLSINTSGPFGWRTTQPKMFTSCQSVEEPSRDVVPVSCLLSDTRLLFHNASKMMFLP